MMVDNVHSQPDSIEIEFNKFYTNLAYTKVLFDSVPFIDAAPSSFMIINGKIQKVFIGALPSPFLLSDIFSSAL